MLFIMLRQCSQKRRLPMSVEQNKALFRRFVEEVFNKGDISAVNELLTPDFVEREELPPGMPRDREGIKQMTMMFRGAFPDFNVTIDDMIAEGDKLVVRTTWNGTQKGEFMGIPPSGKRVSFGVIDIIRISGGKFVEHWGLMDSSAMMQQLGAVPNMQAAG
jgi:steroid delta-isomerase-like uncharacterized protein